MAVENCRRPKNQPAKTPKTTPFGTAKTGRSSKPEGRAMIVALLNQKGGVGKTTLATHIAGELALRGQHVVLLDVDPPGSSLDWTKRRSQQGKIGRTSCRERVSQHL